MNKLNFGRAMVAARKRSDFSQQDLARCLKISQVTISSYEIDRSSPSINNALLISCTLNFSLESLYKQKDIHPGHSYLSLFSGAALREIRKQNGYTQDELSYKLQLGRSLVNKYENNHHVPNLEIVISLSKALKCSIYDLTEPIL